MDNTKVTLPGAAWNTSPTGACCNRDVEVVRAFSRRFLAKGRSCVTVSEEKGSICI